jgi:hypothetical protein
MEVVGLMASLLVKPCTKVHADSQGGKVRLRSRLRIDVQEVLPQSDLWRKNTTSNGDPNVSTVRENVRMA